MAALPKKKRTQSKKGKRWSHSALRPVNLSVCPQCRVPKRSHRVCHNCGYYAGREVVSPAGSEVEERE